MNKIEHIGIAVANLEEAKKTFSKLLGSESYKEESVVSEGVTTAFFDVGGVKIELLEATNKESPIAKFIEKRGEGIHHIAFDVDSVAAKAEELDDKDFIVLNDQPKSGADNKTISFIHPKSSHGVLVELCQDKEE